MSISAEKSGQLQALFSALPDVHKQTLIMTIKAAKADGEPGLPFDELLALLGDEEVCEDRWLEIFSVVQPLVVDKAQRCDQIETSVLASIWKLYLRELDPKSAASWLSGGISRTVIQKSMVETFAEFSDSKSGKKTLEKRIGEDHLHQLEVVMSLLPRSDEMEDFFAGWPDEVKSLDDTHLMPLREFNEHLITDSPEITPHLLFLASFRLAHPFHIFRAVEKVTGHSNDRVMIKTDLKIVGDALLDQNDCWIKAFNWERNEKCNLEDAIAGLKGYIDLTSGWTSEFDVDPAGAWGVRLAKQRLQCGKVWDDHMSRTSKLIDQVLPRKRGSVTGRQTMPNIHNEIDEHKVELAENAIELLVAARPFASQGGFQSSKDKTCQMLESRLEEQSDDLLALLGKGDDDHEQVSAHFTVLVRITRAYLGAKDANVLARRSAAAMAA